FMYSIRGMIIQTDSADIFLHHDPAIAGGLDYLMTNDPVFAGLGVNLDDFTWRRSAGGFGGFVRIVLGQQLSTVVARALWTKTVAALSPLTPERFLSATDEELRACGFSGSKINYVRGLSAAIIDGSFAPEALAGM